MQTILDLFESFILTRGSSRYSTPEHARYEDQTPFMAGAAAMASLYAAGQVVAKLPLPPISLSQLDAFRQLMESVEREWRDTGRFSYYTTGWAGVHLKELLTILEGANKS